MRYRVVTGRPRPKTVSEPLRGPQQPLAVQGGPVGAVRARAARVAPVAHRVGFARDAIRAGGCGSVLLQEPVFSPLIWPGTPRDVVWSSAPAVGRFVSGWAGVGFCD